MFTSNTSLGGIPSFGGGQDSLEDRIKKHMMSNEPPLEQALLRHIVNSSKHYIGLESPDHPVDLSKVRFMVSSDTKKARMSIILPCTGVTEEFMSSLSELMGIYDYKFLRSQPFYAQSEFQIDYTRKDA